MKAAQKELIAKIEDACSKRLKTPTLGGRCMVIFGKDKDGNYAKAGNFTYRITEELIDLVTLRYLELEKCGGANRLGHPAQLSSSQYNKPNWQSCPNNRACPFIAAALKTK
jgi:hypothetical protein